MAKKGAPGHQPNGTAQNNQIHLVVTGKGVRLFSSKE
jgi:hypothetical protein